MQPVTGIDDQPEALAVIGRVNDALQLGSLFVTVSVGIGAGM